MAINYAARIERVNDIFMANDGKIDRAEAEAELHLMVGKSGKVTKTGMRAMCAAFRTSTYENKEVQTRVRDALLANGAKIADLGIDLSPDVARFDGLSKQEKLDELFELVDQDYYDGFIDFGTVHQYEMHNGYSDTILDPARHLSGKVGEKARKAMSEARSDDGKIFFAIVKDGQTYGYGIRTIEDSWHTAEVYTVFDRDMKKVGTLHPLHDQ